MKIQDENRLKERALAKLFITSQRGLVLSGMKARQLFNKYYGVDIDHHVYTDVMDEMTKTGETKIEQGWGDTTYSIL